MGGPAPPICDGAEGEGGEHRAELSDTKRVEGLEGVGGNGTGHPEEQGRRQCIQEPGALVHGGRVTVPD